jgi:DNA-binding MarR family transcriptional regulator
MSEGPDIHVSPAAGYWYEPSDQAARSVGVLNALRQYRTAEQAMRKRTRAAMKMNENDLSALRFLMESGRRGQQVSPTALARRLEVSTASITSLIDRLERAGHVERRPSPSDGRAIIVVPTASSHEEVRHTLGEMHARMKSVADQLTPDEADAVVRFLSLMAQSLAEVDHPHSA